MTEAAPSPSGGASALRRPGGTGRRGFTLLEMMAVMVIIGSFFRGPGQNFVFPWVEGIFFDL